MSQGRSAPMTPAGTPVGDSSQLKSVTPPAIPITPIAMTATAGSAPKTPSSERRRSPKRAFAPSGRATRAGNG